MLTLTHRAGSCENGPCPNVFDVAGDGRVDTVAIQGTTMTDASAPARESAVQVPRHLILDYADLFQGVAAGEVPSPITTDTAAGRRPITIRGEKMTDASALAQLSGMPTHESVVLVPRRLILEYAERIREEGMVDA